VQLGLSGLFTTGRAEMWRNAAVFTARAGGKCGLFVPEFSEGRKIKPRNTPNTLKGRPDSKSFDLQGRDAFVAVSFVFRVVRVVRGECGFFNCPCGGTVSLAEPKERIHFRSKVEAMEEPRNMRNTRKSPVGVLFACLAFFAVALLKPSPRSALARPQCARLGPSDSDRNSPTARVSARWP
jgi:hypothetical protein